MKNNVKLTLAALITTGALVSTEALATSPAPVNPTDPGSQNVVKAINTLGNKVVALSISGITAIDNALFQYDPDLLTSVNASTARQTVLGPVSTAASSATNKDIQTNLENLPNAILSTGMGMINTETIQAQKKAQAQMTNKMTIDVPASDTLYSNNPRVIQSQYTNGSNYYIGPPKTKHDNYLNIGSLTGPMAYSTDQAKAANYYLAYLTKSYENPTNGLNLTDLQSKLNNLPANKQYTTLYSFMTSTPYQDYQLSMRSAMAAKSVALNNFNAMMAERTPSKTAVSGILDDNGKAITHPSPLQITHFVANHRINNPQWIANLQKATDTTLLRKITVMLAEIEQQNDQAHKDRERMIATLTAMQLQGSAANQMILQSKTQAVNTEIKSIGGKPQKTQQSNAQAQLDKVKKESEQKNS